MISLVITDQGPFLRFSLAANNHISNNEIHHTNSSTAHATLRSSSPLSRTRWRLISSFVSVQCTFSLIYGLQKRVRIMLTFRFCLTSVVNTETTLAPRTSCSASSLCCACSWSMGFSLGLGRRDWCTEPQPVL